jgi:hypothetical protein
LSNSTLSNQIFGVLGISKKTTKTLPYFGLKQGISWENGSNLLKKFEGEKEIFISK